MLGDVSHPSCAGNVRVEEEQERVPTHRARGELRSEIGRWPPHHVMHPDHLSNPCDSPNGNYSHYTTKVFAYG